MDCKNCKYSLTNQNKFCPECGAKVIHNKLNFKNLFDQINDQYFSLDNKFFTTIKDLLVKPEIVIDGYINGVRKKYVDVIQFLAISLTLYGFQFLILKTFFSETLITTSSTGNEQLDKITASINEGLFEYMGLISILFIPIISTITYLIFINSYKYNYVEHIVINAYVVAQYTILAFCLFILLMIFGLDTQINFIISSILSYLYIGYSFKKLYNLSIFKTIWKTLLIIITYGIITITIFIFIGIIVGVFFKLTN